MANEWRRPSRRPLDLKSVADDAGTILLRNVYGWFEHVQPGKYRLTAAGIEAVERFEEPAKRLGSSL